jgi:stress response protein SCP2
VLGVPADNFYFVAIEKEFPYNSAVYSLSEDTIMNTAMALGEVKSRISQWKKEQSQASLGLPNANTITLL